MHAGEVRIFSGTLAKFVDHLFPCDATCSLIPVVTIALKDLNVIDMKPKSVREFLCKFMLSLAGDNISLSSRCRAG